MTIRPAWALVLLSCTGCFSVDLYAPHGANVYLISAGKPVKVRRDLRTWYVVWGLVRLDNTMPDTVIAREQLTEVRVITVDTVPDALIGILYNVLIPIGLANQAMTIEGNRAAPTPVGTTIPANPPDTPPTRSPPGSPATGPAPPPPD